MRETSITREERKVLGSRVDSLLQVIMQRRPGLQEWWERYQHMPLAEYAQTLLVNNATALQPREDVADVIQQSASILGEDRAKHLAQQVLERPVIITANHHGPDFIGLTRQGVAVFSLAMHEGQDVLVTACGAVPQNNVTYPRGIPLARTLTEQDMDGAIRTIPLRINIMPDSQREALVSASKPMTREMIEGDGKKNRGAVGQVDKLQAEGKIGDEEAHALQTLLREDYLPVVSMQNLTLAVQFTLINDRLWQREFDSDLQKQIPSLAYLELESITGGLLEKDLANPNSLAYKIFFDPQLRNRIIQTLDGVDSCWNTTKLNRLSSSTIDTAERISTMGGAGTIFFTGIDAKGRRVPLNLVEEKGAGERRLQGQLKLKGVDKSGNFMEVDFTPDSLQKALAKRRIVPSVFTDFVEILSRGLRAHGGFNQGNYYPQIKAGIVQALQATGRSDWADVIDTVPTDNLTAGLMFGVAHYENGLKPLGGVELVAQPLTVEDYKKMGQLIVREAFLFGAPDMYRVVCSEVDRKAELLAVTESDIYRYIGDRYVAREF